MFAPRTGLVCRPELAPSLGQPAVHGGVGGAGELDDLGVAVAGRLQEQVASLARLRTLEPTQSIGVLFQRDQSIDGLAGQARGLDDLARIDGREEPAYRRLASGKARELPCPPSADDDQPVHAAAVEGDVVAADEHEPRERTGVVDGGAIDGARLRRYAADDTAMGP